MRMGCQLFEVYFTIYGFVATFSGCDMTVGHANSPYLHEDSWLVPLELGESLRLGAPGLISVPSLLHFSSSCGGHLSLVDKTRDEY